MFHCQTKGTVHLLKPVEFQPQRNCSLGTTDSAVRSRRDIGRSIDRVAAGVGLISIPIARDLSRNVLSLAAAGPPFGEHVLRMRITAHTRITPVGRCGHDTISARMRRYGVHFRHAGRYQIFNKRGGGVAEVRSIMDVRLWMPLHSPPLLSRMEFISLFSRVL